MKTRTFSNYESACAFRDKVDGQIEWCKYKGKPYWIVWYSQKKKKGCNMAYVELVIKIPEEKYNEIHSLKFVQYGLQSEENKKFFYLLINAIQDGTPLPKGHGRLIDADAVTKDFNSFHNAFVVNSTMGGVFKNVVCVASTIIESDKIEPTVNGDWHYGSEPRQTISYSGRTTIIEGEKK